MSRRRVVWIDPKRILPLHNVKRVAALRELVAKMRQRIAQGKDPWDGRPLLVERIQGEHFMSWTGTHRLAAAKVVGIKVPCELVRGGKPARRYALAAGTTDDLSRYNLLRRRRDPAASAMRKEILTNQRADRLGIL